MKVIAKDLAGLRYRALIDELGKEYGFARGWKTRVANALGVHKSYVTGLTNGRDIHVGEMAIRAAMRGIGLRADYFTADEATSYRAFRDEGSIEGADADEFLASLCPPLPVLATSAIGLIERGEYEAARAVLDALIGGR